MERLTEIRATGGTAYEMRNGSRVEYANTVDGQHRRMRALGCPEIVLVRAKRRLAARSAAPASKPTTQLTDAERRRKAATLGAKITADADADRKRRANAQAAQIASDSEQERKDKELAGRMANAAGRVSR